MEDGLNEQSEPTPTDAKQQEEMSRATMRRRPLVTVVSPVGEPAAG